MDGVEAVHISPLCVNIYSGGNNGNKKIRIKRRWRYKLA